MALALPKLTSDFTDIFKGDNPVGLAVGLDVATAISGYWDTGLSDKGGAVVSAAAIPLMGPTIGKAFTDESPSRQLAAMDLANAIGPGFAAIIIAGGAHGIGGALLPATPALQGALISLFSGEATTRIQFATDFAKAIDDFTKASTIFGIGIPPAFVPPGPFLT